MPPNKSSEKAKSGGKSGKSSKGDGGKGKKKGGKKKAKAKLSEDAKNRQMEQRAAVEEERRRMREELINSFLRHKLSKEHCLTRLNQSKLIEKWRHALRDAKSKELTRELEMMKIDFDKRFAENNSEINRLMDVLVRSGVDFVNLSDAHKKATKATNDEHMSRLHVLEEFYQKERDSLQVVMTTDYQKAMVVHFEEKGALLRTINSLQSHYCKSFTEQKRHFQIRKDEIINQGLEDEQMTRQILERRLERKWQQLHESCVEGGESDDQRWALYVELKRQDESALEVQRQAEMRIENLNTAISRIQEPQDSRDHQDRQALIALRNELYERRERWRIKLLKQQQLHVERLKAVATGSSEAAEYLEQLAKQGVLILRSAQRCNLLKPKSTSILKSGKNPSSTTPSEPFENFWTRFNTAYLETVLLQRHQMALARNEKLESAQRLEKRSFPDRWVLSGTTISSRVTK